MISSFVFMNEKQTQKISVVITKKPASSAPVKKIKQSIPKQLRMACWNTYIGKLYNTMCPCCNIVNITSNGSEWDCGHINSEAKGGATELTNLRVICSGCNKSMGTTHMKEFARAFSGAENRLFCDLPLCDHISATHVNEKRNSTLTSSINEVEATLKQCLPENVLVKNIINAVRTKNMHLVLEKIHIATNTYETAHIVMDAWLSKSLCNKLNTIVGIQNEILFESNKSPIDLLLDLEHWKYRRSWFAEGGKYAWFSNKHEFGEMTDESSFNRISDPIFTEINKQKDVNRARLWELTKSALRDKS